MQNYLIFSLAIHNTLQYYGMSLGHDKEEGRKGKRKKKKKGARKESQDGGVDKCRACFIP